MSAAASALVSVEEGGPFTVDWGYGEQEKFPTFTEALATKRKLDAAGENARIFGDGVDFDCDGDGYFMCSDGLTEEQRDLILSDDEAA